MNRTLTAGLLAGLLAVPAFAQQLTPGQQKYRALFQELVETNTQLSNGDCTALAQKIAGHLRQAGFADRDIRVFTAPDHPKEGGIVATLAGTDPRAKAVLLLGHLDVVEARREDWTRDPFKLVEEGGYFYGRGVSDMKSLDADWIDTMMRLKQEGVKAPRALKMALTCGEETASAFNGANWLATHERALIDAEFALNEGGGGRLDKDGNPVVMTVQAAEKFPQDYKLEVTNPGGHSARPVPKNAINQLAAGLVKIAAYQFPIQATDITRGYFAKMASQVGGQMGAAMTAFARDPTDAKASAVLATDPNYNALLHTTCIATMLSGGHATNALPQRATANINCRIFPGTAPEQVRQKLAELSGDPEIKVTFGATRRDVPKGPQTLNPMLFGVVEMLTAKYWPGTPVIPGMSAAATDGVFLAPVGIPTYGVSGNFGDPDGDGVHGLNEKKRVSSLYRGRDFVYDLVRILLSEP